TVTIKLPFAAQTEADTKTTTPAKTVKQKRILVIDDEMVVRGVIQEILQDEGYQVVDAATGEDGIILFNKEHFDLVITDLGMPVMSGWDVTQILKSINQEVPVILLTGWATQTDLVKAKESGVDMVLGKPISSNDLVEAVLQILKKN
ncbi:MAG: response regulator, partial [Blastocatellia bacterium]|nr:response regulator [Blastocatellia bacterium]